VANRIGRVFSLELYLPLWRFFSTARAEADTTKPDSWAYDGYSYAVSALGAVEGAFSAALITAHRGADLFRQYSYGEHIT